MEYIVSLLQQLGPGPNSQFDPSSPWMYVYIVSLAVIPVFMLYGQKMQSKVILNDVSKSLFKLKKMKEDARVEALDYVRNSIRPASDPSKSIDKFLEYFTIMPVDMDPNGLMRKLEHIMRTRDDRMRAEVQKLCSGASSEQLSRVENILEAATALNMIYKVVRHFYLMGKRTTSMFVLVQLQMAMPILLEQATALQKAIGTFEKGQPIGDGIGPMVVGQMMLGREKKFAAKETVYSTVDLYGRKLYLLKAEGPSGSVGRPGEAIVRLARDLGIRFSAVVMIDAALKLEGEKTGEVAEGIGAAIGGIGVEKYQIEEVTTRLDIPLFAIVVKQSVEDAITLMRKEIFDSLGQVTETLNSVIQEKTQDGDAVLVVGVGNTMGVGQ
ncbi:MAG: DUF1512 domain-containing protein [Nitrososphaera sp.]